MNNFEPHLTTEIPNTGPQNGGLHGPEGSSKYEGMEILPPPISKTKGSRNKKTANSKPASATKKKKIVAVKLEKKGNPVKGQRTCSVCGEMAGHNARSCPEDPRRAQGKVIKKNKRICQGCNQVASGHNILTCPVIKEALAIAKARDKSDRKSVV